MGIDKRELKKAKFNQGGTVYIVESNRFVREAELKYYGIDDNNIRKAINELFHLSFAI